MKITRVGVDIAKSVFHVHGVDRHDKKVWTGKLTRSKWLAAVCEKVEPGSEIGMEACAGSHHWARELSSRGYIVKLIAAQFVKPYVKSNKNDSVDAEAISEAMSRPSMRYVRPKTIAQQDVQAIHRVRTELVGQRTAKVNQIRGLVGEYGIVAPVGINQLRRALPCWLEDAENGLSSLFRELLQGLWRDLRNLDERVVELDESIQVLVKEDPVARRLSKLRGVGPITATALSVALGDGRGFKCGRDFAVSLGLTPKQHSTGGKERLLGISKRGDPYLRTLLVHGARAVVAAAKRHSQSDSLSEWIKDLSARKHANVVNVALANKTARIAWALVRHQREYEPSMTMSV